MALFESYERRIDKINAVLNSYGIASLEEAEKITKDAGLDVYNQIKGIQPICFENACWAYTVGAAIAIKKGCRRAADAAAAIGIGLQAFCIPGSVADTRKVGLGHGNLGKMLLEEETDCFCFLDCYAKIMAVLRLCEIADTTYLSAVVNDRTTMEEYSIVREMDMGGSVMREKKQNTSMEGGTVNYLHSPNKGMKMPKMQIEKGTKGPVHATKGILGVSYRSQ